MYIRVVNYDFKVYNTSTVSFNGTNLQFAKCQVSYRLLKITALTGVLIFVDIGALPSLLL